MNNNEKNNEKLEYTPFKRWKPIFQENYFYISDSGNIECCNYEESDTDLFRMGQRNIFRTENAAKEYLGVLKTKGELRILSNELNNGQKVDWENISLIKHYISFQYNFNEISEYHTTHIQDIGGIYCLDDNYIKIAKERIGEEKLIKMIQSGV